MELVREKEKGNEELVRREEQGSMWAAVTLLSTRVEYGEARARGCDGVDRSEHGMTPVLRGRYRGGEEDGVFAKKTFHCVKVICNLVQQHFRDLI